MRTSGQSHIIEHKEFLGTVTGTNAYVGTTYAINPGVAATFPWLSTQAVAWEMYRFRALCFTYTGSIGTGAAGKVITIPEYDPDDSPPSTLNQAYSMFGMKRCSVWDQSDMRFEPHLMHAVTPWKNVRSGLTPGSLATYDVGTVTVATNGATDGVNLGDFFVSYSVEFKVPQLGTTKPFVSSFLYSDFALTGEIKIAGTGSSLFIPGTTTILLDQLGLGAPSSHGTYANGVTAYGWQLLKYGTYLIRLYNVVLSSGSDSSSVNTVITLVGPGSALSGTPALGLATSIVNYSIIQSFEVDEPTTCDSTFPVVSAQGSDQRLTPGVLDSNGDPAVVKFARCSIIYMG